MGGNRTMIKIENKHLGTMYLDVSEEERIKLLDSNKKYVGYVCTFDDHDLSRKIAELEEMANIYDIVDLGFNSNMMFGKSIEDVVETYMDYIDGYVEENDANEIKESLSEYINVIGNNYFLVDYHEL